MEHEVDKRNRINSPTTREKNIAAALRRIACVRLDSMPVEVAARALGLLPRGVEVLRRQGSWSLETAFRVCEALELNVIEHIEFACLDPLAGKEKNDGIG